MLVEIESHFPYFVRILAKTSSPGTSLAVPSSIWDKDFFIDWKVEARQKLLNQAQTDVCRKG
jgi:hypothetical protein